MDSSISNLTYEETQSLRTKRGESKFDLLGLPGGNIEKDIEHDVDEDIEHDGSFYLKQRDPPGQKSVYILPGNPANESYRLGTFLHFPEDAVVDVCDLARHGFYYTGYKDRVKCFSCGLNVLDWTDTDLPNDAQWHYIECEFLNHTDKRNRPIIKKKLNFTGKAIHSMPNLNKPLPSSSGRDSDRFQSNDSGFCSTETASFNTLSCGSKEQKVTQAPPRRMITADEIPTTSSDSHLSREMSVMQIGSSSQLQPKPAHLMQTAKVVVAPKRRIRVEGLEFASIVSRDHQHMIEKELDLHKEEDRRKSFHSWKHKFPLVTPEALAKSGFFYLGNADRVQCFSCSGVLRNWSEYDEVEDQHRRHFSSCRMVLNSEKRNIPIFRSEPSANSSRSLVEPSDPSPEEMESLKIQFPCLSPVSPHMRDLEARIKTFDQRWPSNKVKASVLHIAKAGFFFLGERDRAKCWYCNGGLQNWEPNDEPFTEHAKWFPGCEFILQTKGLEFVKRIVMKYPNLSRPPLRNPRFDHRTKELIPIAPNMENQLPVIIDPQANNNSAGNVLRNYSSTSTTSQSQTITNGENVSQFNTVEFEKGAELMGFTKPHIKQVIKRQIKEKKRNFENLESFVGALLEHPELPEEQTERMDVNHVQGPPLVLANENPSSLKRNSNGCNSNMFNGHSSRGEEAPTKKSRTDTKLESDLASLENERSCKSCHKNVADNVVMHCGHLCLCNSCAKTTKSCPLCKKKIHSLIRAYLS